MEVQPLIVPPKQEVSKWSLALGIAIGLGLVFVLSGPISQQWTQANQSPSGVVWCNGCGFNLQTVVLVVVIAGFAAAIFVATPVYSGGRSN